MVAKAGARFIQRNFLRWGNCIFVFGDYVENNDTVVE
jgi:hypothetical protein